MPSSIKSFTPPNSLDAIEETSESSDDAFFIESTLKPTGANNTRYGEIKFEPPVETGEIVLVHGANSFAGLPETIMEEDEEDDDSSCNSIELDEKENYVSDFSVDMEPDNSRPSLSEKLASSRNQRQLSGQLSVSDFDTGSVALFNFDDSSSDDGTLLRSDQSSVSLGHSIRNADDDDELLSWRLNPSESLSDWSICVHNLQSNTTDEYHVHRNMLAVGKRKSAFFVDLFKQRPRHPVTDFYFCEDAAKFIPMVLDWIYLGDCAIQLSADSAPGLRHIAQCLGLRKLFDLTMAFMKSNLSRETLATYYVKATALKDQKILNVVARFFARKIEIIDTEDEIMTVMHPDFFRNILSQPGLGSPEMNVHKTVMICSFCEKHKSSLTEDEFLLLTGEKYLRQVHYGAAIQFLELELELAPAHTNRINQSKEPTPLQTKCINAIAPRWKEAAEIQKEAIERIMERLPSFIATKIMMQALERASQELDKQVLNSKDEAIALRKRVKARVKATYTRK